MAAQRTRVRLEPTFPKREKHNERSSRIIHLIASTHGSLCSRGLRRPSNPHVSNLLPRISFRLSCTLCLSRRNSKNRTPFGESLICSAWSVTECEAHNVQMKMNFVEFLDRVDVWLSRVGTSNRRSLFRFSSHQRRV